MWRRLHSDAVSVSQEKLDKTGRSMGSRLEHSKTFTLGQSRTADEIKMLPVLHWTSSSSASISWRWWWLRWWLRTSSHWRWRQEQTSHQEGHKVNARWGSKHMITIIIKHTKDTMYQTWWSEATNRSCIEFRGWIVVVSNFRKFHMVTLWPRISNGSFCTSLEANKNQPDSGPKGPDKLSSSFQISELVTSCFSVFEFPGNSKKTALAAVPNLQTCLSPVLLKLWDYPNNAGAAISPEQITAARSIAAACNCVCA